ncbi:hypothetical protein CIRMBP1277_01620 [Enterococcus cecorum]|nr:hypothetical protein CIRMBP1277_01620 [Enterococcus cecorum]
MKNILLIDYDASSKIPGCRFAIQKFYEQHIMKGILKLNLITVKFNNLPNSEVNFRYMKVKSIILCKILYNVLPVSH